MSGKTSRGFDYEVRHTCMYPVPAPNTPEGEAACREPAAYYGWWDSEGAPDYEHGWWLCEEHLAAILSVIEEETP